MSAPLRVAVIGAGAIGSATARFLAREGHRVTVLEQFELDHDRGGSWGASRIIRKTYPDRLYTELMAATYPLWDELEREAGETLLVRTGGLFFGRPSHPDVETARKALEDNHVAFETLDAAAAARRFPAIRLNPNEIGLHEHDAGFLRASASVRASMRGARAAGAVLRERTRVRCLNPRAGAVEIKLAGGELVAVDRVVVATGSWTQPFLAPFVTVPLAVTRQVYCHFRPLESLRDFERGSFPVWIDLEQLFYGFPSSDNPPGVKVAWHTRGAATDPDAVDRVLHAADREPLIGYRASRLPGLSGDVLFEKVCLYASSPDEHFILDKLPGEPRIVLFAGDSGHAFKFSVLLGRIIASMIAGEPIRWDLSRFSLSRFGEESPQ
jgi:monomeric sarcosine oxidase